MQIYTLGKYFDISESSNNPTDTQAKSLIDLINHLKEYGLETESPSFEDVESELTKANGYGRDFKKEIIIDFFNHLFIDDLHKMW